MVRNESNRLRFISKTRLSKNFSRLIDATKIPARFYRWTRILFSLDQSGDRWRSSSSKSFVTHGLHGKDKISVFSISSRRNSQFNRHFLVVTSLSVSYALIETTTRTMAMPSLIGQKHLHRHALVSTNRSITIIITLDLFDYSNSMSTLCRFVIPSTLSSIEDACVAEFNEYKKRMKEISQHKAANKRSANAPGGLAGPTASHHDASPHHPKDPVRTAEQAKEAAKKLVQSGAIKVLAQGKDHGFKRATSTNAAPERLNKKFAFSPATSSPSIGAQSNPFQPISFVSSSAPAKALSNTPQENKRNVVNYDDADNYSWSSLLCSCPHMYISF